MGRNKKNKPRRERSMFGSPEVDAYVSEAMSMAIRTNTISAAVRGRGRLEGLMVVRNFDTFDGVLEAMAYLEGLGADVFIILPDVIELECRLSELPNIDKGTLMLDPHTRRTARVYRYATEEAN
ncbi:hypothetical protein P1P68_05575 [Streptomyces scabiei]|uniref:hypothetical protein n=1 Tax=Streptomyces scabiei TaxID=1930 RepID=UPI0029901B83|nr:hypothetical protein [Streptomyces scabiei]MDW8804273.1 hypothetical protein [Streptomyces scabiei]